MTHRRKVVIIVNIPLIDIIVDNELGSLEEVQVAHVVRMAVRSNHNINIRRANSMPLQGCDGESMKHCSSDTNAMKQCDSNNDAMKQCGSIKNAMKHSWNFLCHETLWQL